jgi:hypothetical protein
MFLAVRSCDGSRRRPPQERGIDEDGDHRVTGVPIQSPEASRLGRREAQAGHFHELGTNASHGSFEIHHCPLGNNLTGIDFRFAGKPARTGPDVEFPCIRRPLLISSDLCDRFEGLDSRVIPCDRGVVHDWHTSVRISFEGEFESAAFRQFRWIVFLRPAFLSQLCRRESDWKKTDYYARA